MFDKTVILFIIVLVSEFILVGCYDLDADRNVTELITSRGYRVTDHDVITPDGFVLSVQHMPPQARAAEGPPIVVFLQHPLLGGSHDWVINSPNQSLGFILSDLGYDVWLGNSRGNSYSRRHLRYSSSSRKFWSFSVDEMALIDLPAMIDYVLNRTGQPSLIYVAHSQGTSLGFALLSERPAYNHKIKLFAAMGPVATVGYITCPIRHLAPSANDIANFLSLFGQYEFLPQKQFIKWFAQYCPNEEVVEFCQNMYFIFNGINVEQLNISRASVYLNHDPAGTSTFNILHWAQMVQSRKFCKFDYGTNLNLRHYNQTTPPEYNVSLITTPVALFSSLNDPFADPIDVALLSRKLRRLVLNYSVSEPSWGHVDFILGIQAAELVYAPLVALLQEYTA